MKIPRLRLSGGGKMMAIFFLTNLSLQGTFSGVNADDFWGGSSVDFGEDFGQESRRLDELDQQIDTLEEKTMEMRRGIEGSNARIDGASKAMQIMGVGCLVVFGIVAIDYAFAEYRRVKKIKAKKLLYKERQRQRDALERAKGKMIWSVE